MDGNALSSFTFARRLVAFLYLQVHRYVSVGSCIRHTFATPELARLLTRNVDDWRQMDARKLESV